MFCSYKREMRFTNNYFSLSFKKLDIRRHKDVHIRGRERGREGEGKRDVLSTILQIKTCAHKSTND
jgi:hypothetical protein